MSNSEILDRGGDAAEMKPDYKSQPSFIKPTAEHGRSSILIVSPLDESRRHLAAAIAQEKNRVAVVDTLREALEEIREHEISRLLLDFRCLDWLEALSQAVELSGSDCPVKTFHSVSELLLEYDNSSSGNPAVFTSSLRLPVAALARQLGKSPESSVRVGPYVERLCRRMKLSDQILLEAVSIAYLTDTMRMLSSTDIPLDRERALFKLLSVAGDDCLFPPQAVNIIRQMYQPVKSLESQAELSPDALPANIVSIVDYFFEMFGIDEPLSVNRFELVKSHLVAHSGNLFLSEVVTSFLLLLEDDIDRSSAGRKAPLVMIYDESAADQELVRSQLRDAGFDITSITDIEELGVQFQRFSPDMLLMLLTGSGSEALNRIRQIVNRGFPVHRVPAFLILENRSLEHLSEFLKLGIEDVLTSVDNLDALIVKVRRVWDARERDSLQRLEVLQTMGTNGSLGDMGVIDLLQAMGLSDKFFRISISAYGQQLVMYLGRNRILHAETDSLAGEKAVFEALKWERGIWSVDPVGADDVPSENVHRTIDSILIQGCYLVDQQKRQEPAQE